jgi:Tetracyclin repressor-like, C-terminal domain
MVALEFDAYRHAVNESLVFPNTGDILTDLRTQLHAFIHLLMETRAGQVILELMGQAQTDADLREALVKYYTTPRRQLAVERMQQGKSYGQIQPDVDLYAVIDQLWGACYYRLWNMDLPVTEEFVDTLLNNIWKGISNQ